MIGVRIQVWVSRCACDEALCLNGCASAKGGYKCVFVLSVVVERNAFVQNIANRGRSDSVCVDGLGSIHCLGRHDADVV